MMTGQVILMPFGRRSSSLQPVNSIKHIIDSEGALSGANASNTPIASAVTSLATTFNPVEVRVGSKINAFFISLFVIGATGAPLTQSINWFIWKEHEGQALSAPSPGATGISKVRNQIIHEEKGLAGSGDGTPMAFKGVIVVPRGMRRMREGDIWNIRLNSLDATVDATFCIKAIYKSFS